MRDICELQLRPLDLINRSNDFAYFSALSFTFSKQEGRERRFSFLKQREEREEGNDPFSDIQKLGLKDSTAKVPLSRSFFASLSAFFSLARPLPHNLKSLPHTEAPFSISNPKSEILIFVIFFFLFVWKCSFASILSTRRVCHGVLSPSTKLRRGLSVSNLFVIGSLQLTNKCPNL